MAHLLEILLRPALLLALVPLIRFGFEKIFSRVFENSTEEALEKAASSSNRIEAVRNAVAKKDVRAALAQYVENASTLERFLETCFFTGFSLLIFLLSEAEKRWEQMLCGLLLFVVIGALVMVSVRAFKGSYEPGRKDATKKPALFAQIFTVIVVVLEFISAVAKGIHG